MSQPAQSAPTGRNRGPSPSSDSPRRRPLTLVILGLLALILFSGFIALGVWQVERRAWKLDLIDRVNHRVHAAAIAAPHPARWPAVNREDSEYQHVTLTGTFLNDKETLVQATTELGRGYWVMTPLRRDDGSLVMINRGFVSPAHKDPAKRGQPAPSGVVTVTGLLRLSEPGGGVLRDNVPAQDRWYSRDVQAMARARGLATVAPYFVDAQADTAGRWPVGGLTVIRFHNSHLVYAITWFGLALMVLIASVYVVRDERRLRRSR
ncbi:MAG: SURF1 family protein [Alcanivorax sp.]|nr:SURF1 family protein [Alcanivorax sp.]